MLFDVLSQVNLVSKQGERRNTVTEHQASLILLEFFDHDLLGRSLLNYVDFVSKSLLLAQRTFADHDSDLRNRRAHQFFLFHLKV